MILEQHRVPITSYFVKMIAFDHLKWRQNEGFDFLWKHHYAFIFTGSWQIITQKLVFELFWKNYWSFSAPRLNHNDFILVISCFFGIFNNINALLYAMLLFGDPSRFAIMPSFWLSKHEFLSPRNAQENGPKHDFLVPWLGEDIPKSGRLGKQLTVRVSLHRFEGVLLFFAICP